MKAQNLTLCIIVFLGTCLISCFDEDTPPVTTPLVETERYFDGETGEQVAIKTYHYDSLNRLVEAHYVDFKNEVANKKITYIYDEMEPVIQKQTHYYNQTENFEIVEFRYKGENLVRETITSGLGSILSIKEFFYSGKRLDSIQYYWKEMNGLVHNFTELLKYENDLLTEKTRRDARDNSQYLEREYHYNGNQLVSECSHGGHCLHYSYSDGRLAKIESSRNEDHRELQEEYFYQSNLLKEKKMYSYPVYTFGDTLDISQIIYDYTF